METTPKPDTVQYHIEQGHIVFEDIRGWQGYEYSARHGVIITRPTEFVPDDSESLWGCANCRIDSGLTGTEWIRERI